MESIVKQCVGIDCDKTNLVVNFMNLLSDQHVKTVATRSFKNNVKGIEDLWFWAQKRSKSGIELVFAVEATGVYHQRLAFFLADKKAYISVLLPSKTSNYMKAQTLKTINDKTAAKCIAEYGLRHKLDLWVKPDMELLSMRSLMREREASIKLRTILSNQLHAAEIEIGNTITEIKRIKQHIGLINKQIAAIEKEADKIAKSDPKIKKKFDNVLTIPGAGAITVYTIVSETFGFNLFNSSRQLVSYSGLDIRTKDSGTSVHSKPKISKRGNRHIRRALYFPAFTSAKYNEDHGKLYARLVGKHGIRLKAAVAVQRKLLVLIYTLWKNDEQFDPNWQTQQKKSGHSPRTTSTPKELVPENCS